MMNKFDKKKDELLIEMVKRFRSIYDASDKNYKNNIEKHKCWEKISAIVTLPVSECKKRWKSLRDQYNKKKKDLGTDSAKINFNWEYGTLMSFLSDSVLDKCETVSAELESQRLPSPTTDDKDNAQNNIQADTQQHLLLEDDNNTQDDPQGSIQNTHANEQFSQNIEAPKIKKRKTNPARKRETQRSFAYKNLLENTFIPLPVQTPIRKFFDSMADIVDTFPRYEQATIRLKVCQLVTETEIKLLQLPHVARSIYTNSSISTTASTFSSRNSKCSSPDTSSDDSN